MQTISDFGTVINNILKYSTKIVYYLVVLISLVCLGLMIYYLPPAEALESQIAGLSPAIVLGASGIMMYPLRNMAKEKSTLGAVFSVGSYGFTIWFAIYSLAEMDMAGILVHTNILEYIFLYIPDVVILLTVMSFTFNTLVRLWSHGTATAR